MPLIPCNLLFLCFVVGVAFAVLSDVPSAPLFVVDVFSFAVHAEVGVLAPEEFRWEIFLGEDLERLVVFALSSAEASPLCVVGEAGEKEKESARGTFPSSHRPPRAFYFFDYFILMGYPAGASAEERVVFVCHLHGK